MSPPRPESKSRRQTRKPTLMESYASAFNDEHLQTIVDKIRNITSRPTNRPEAEGASLQEHHTPLSKPSSKSIDQSIDHPIDQSSGHSTIESTIESTNRPNEISIVRPKERPNERPNETLLDINSPKTVILNENQVILYYCIKQLRGRISSLQRIGQAIGISAFTLKHCLRKLREQEAITYHGRQNSVGRMGFAADALPCMIVLRGNEHRLRQRLEEINYERLPITRSINTDSFRLHTGDGPPDSLMDDLLNSQMTGVQEHVLCSSSKKKLLQGLILEKAFEDLNPRSLLPYLGHIETAEALQEFLDMANACFAAAFNTESPIKNPKGFLFAQLKVGYINPPEGYKSRRIKAQEMRNRRLEAELAELRRLKAEEDRLELEVFRARLTAKEQQQLAQEARARVNPHGLLSEARQLDMAQEDILRDWLEARGD